MRLFILFFNVPKLSLSDAIEMFVFAAENLVYLHVTECRSRNKSLRKISKPINGMSLQFPMSTEIVILYESEKRAENPHKKIVNKTDESGLELNELCDHILQTCLDSMRNE